MDIKIIVHLNGSEVVVNNTIPEWNQVSVCSDCKWLEWNWGSCTLFNKTLDMSRLRDNDYARCRECRELTVGPRVLAYDDNLEFGD